MSILLMSRVPIWIQNSVCTQPKSLSGWLINIYIKFLQCSFILHAKKTAFVVEHDFIMSTYLADRVIVFDGMPAIKANANTYELFHYYFFNFKFRPQTLVTGMNRFLSQLNITFRRDNESNRPRINKKDSQLDAEQKKSGDYFYLETV